MILYSLATFILASLESRVTLACVWLPYIHYRTIYLEGDTIAQGIAVGHVHIDKSRPLSLMSKVLPSHGDLAILDWPMLEIFQRQKFQSVKTNNVKCLVNWIS